MKLTGMYFNYPADRKCMKYLNFPLEFLCGFCVLSAFLLFTCSPYFNDKYKLRCGDSVDYCNNFAEIKRKIEATKAEKREYGVAYWCCRTERLNNHQRDSLTTDTCLCRKRLIKVFDLEPEDSFTISFEPATRFKRGKLYWGEKAPVLGGCGEVIIDKNCRIIKGTPCE
jgi:hypothetical protein